MVYEKKGISSIHALRGIGALGVVVFHAGSLYPQFNFKMGAAGVDLFFVISGIVMQLAFDPKVTALQFIQRRIVRVVPMYWLATAAALAYYLSRYPEYPPTSDHIIRSFFFLPPPSGTQMPFLYPGWTLNFEMFFYMALAFAIATRKTPMLLTACLVTLTASLAVALPPEATPYYANPLILEFVMGLCIGHVIKQGITVTRLQGTLLVISAISLYLLHNTYKSTGILAWGVPAVLLIIGGLAFEKSAIVNNRFARAAGNSSYSVYLIHPFPIWFMEDQAKGQSGITHFIFAIISSIILGHLCHLLLEKPITRILSAKRSSTLALRH